MAFDEQLAARIRSALSDLDGVTERKMFGGIVFMLRGNMACGVIGEALLVRLGEEGADAALEEPHTRIMDFTGRPSRTVIYVDPPGVATDAQLAAWIRRAVAFADALPPKG
jgi:TfoX/Sxy family transcriptional regulator of competence genes